MSLLRTKSKSVVYLGRGQLFSAYDQVLSGSAIDPLATTSLLTEWLEEHQKRLGPTQITVELAGDFTQWITLPFSIGMTSPAVVQGMAERYARHALGELAPVYYQVVEPLHYGQPPLVLGLKPEAAALQELPWPGLCLQSYALAAWNHYETQLEDEPGGIWILEPRYLTLLLHRNGRVEEALGRPVQPGSHLDCMEELRSHYFHRIPVDCRFLDEFSMLDGTTPPWASSLDSATPRFAISGFSSAFA